MFSVSHTTPPITPPIRRLEVHKKLGMDAAETADPNPPKGFPDHMTTCSAYKAVGWRRKKVCSELWCLSSQVRDLLSWRWLNNFLLMGNEFLSFCTLTLPIHFPIPLWGVRKWLCGVVLPASVKPQLFFFFYDPTFISQVVFFFTLYWREAAITK